MDHSFVSAFVLLLLVLDPFGSLPVFISVLKGVPPERRRPVALREATIALAVLLAFMVAGQGFLRLMHLSEARWRIEKLMGLVLTLIAVEMVLAGLKRYFFEAP